MTTRKPATAKQREASLHNWRLFQLKGSIVVILASVRPWLNANEYNQLVRLLKIAQVRVEDANYIAMLKRTTPEPFEAIPEHQPISGVKSFARSEKLRLVFYPFNKSKWFLWPRLRFERKFIAVLWLGYSAVYSRKRPVMKLNDIAR